MHRTRNNQSNKLILIIGITVFLVIMIGGVTIYLLKKTGYKKTETTPWYVTLRTSYWYDNVDYDATTRSRLATLSWYTSEIESENDLDDLLDEWNIRTTTSTSTTTTTTRVMTTTTTTPFSPDDYFFYGYNQTTLLNATRQFYGFFGPYNITTNFTAHNQSFNSFYIHVNGYVQFKLGSYNYISIAPFYSAVDTSKIATIYHGEVTDEKMIQSIAADVNKLCKYDNFTPSWSYIVTWYEMQPYVSFYRYSYRTDYSRSSYNYSNTFQLLLTSNGNESFAIYNFVRMDWPNEYVSNYFSSFYYYYYYDFEQSNIRYMQSILENNSVRNLTDKSNMGKPGRWFISFNNSNCQF